MIQWNELKDLDQLEAIKTQSESKTILVFKHSTRCSTSKMMLDRFQRNWVSEEMTDVVPYFVDLINYREVSNGIAKVFEVEHESPQVILIRDGNAFYNGSHFEIEYAEIKKLAS